MSRSRVEKTRAARAVRFSERSDIEMRSSLTVAGGDSAPAEGGSSAKKLVKITTSERACKPESSFIEPVSQKLQVLSSSEVLSRQSGGMRERKPVVELPRVLSVRDLVDLVGIEPTTSSMPWK